jgi:hypothetical protein
VPPTISLYTVTVPVSGSVGLALQVFVTFFVAVKFVESIVTVLFDEFRLVV